MAEEILIVKKGNGTVIFLSIMLFVTLVLLYFGVYKMYFQFNASDVKDYIKEAADKYEEKDRAAAYKLIQDGVKEVMKNREKLKQVLVMARKNGTPREMELVHSALMDAINLGYINKI